MRLSIQLYTVRELLKDDFEGTLRAVKAAGLNNVEGGFGDRDPHQTKDLLDEIGLTLSGAHEGFDSVENDLDHIIAKNKILGNSSVIVGWLDRSIWTQGWKKVAERFNVIGAKVKEAGLTFAYHNHNFEFELEDGKPGLDVLYENTDPDLVKAQLDVAWVLQGGQDPAVYIHRYAHRLDSVHLKDTLLKGHHFDCVAGTGDVEWNSVLEACAKAGVATGSLEMDNPPGDAMEDVKGCVAFFHARGIH
jgi:sugar phosphate isomerase/epimerase